jgi:hypothetical protein
MACTHANRVLTPKLRERTLAEGFGRYMRYKLASHIRETASSENEGVEIIAVDDSLRRKLSQYTVCVPTPMSVFRERYKCSVAKAVVGAKATMRRDQAELTATKAENGGMFAKTPRGRQQMAREEEACARSAKALAEARAAVSLARRIGSELDKWQEMMGGNDGAPDVVRCYEYEVCLGEIDTQFGSFGTMAIKWLVISGEFGVMIDSGEVRQYRDN